MKTIHFYIVQELVKKILLINSKIKFQSRKQWMLKFNHLEIQFHRALNFDHYFKINFKNLFHFFNVILIYFDLFFKENFGISFNNFAYYN